MKVATRRDQGGFGGVVRVLCPALAGWLLALVPAGGREVYFPRPVLANRSVGLLESRVGGDWFRGSGVVAYDRRLIFSCAHVFYERGRWADAQVFYRAWHARREPQTREGVRPRGLHYFTTYARAVRSFGADSDEAFASDFTVLYGNQGFGSPAAVWRDSGPLLRSARPKRIVGYPFEIDYTLRPGYHLQHSTGWFRYKARRMFGRYLEFDDVSTGAGNSGGGIFIRNEKTGKELLGGILVSGGERLAGVLAFDLLTEGLARQVLLGAGNTAADGAGNPAVQHAAGGFIIRDTADGVTR